MEWPSSPKCGAEKTSWVQPPANPHQPTKIMSTIYQHEGGKGGDEQIVYFAERLGFQYDPALRFYRSTAQAAENFLIGLGYTIEFP